MMQSVSQAVRKEDEAQDSMFRATMQASNAACKSIS